MFDRFFDEHVNFLKCALLAAGLMLALIAYLATKYPAFAKYKTGFDRSFIAIAAISVLAFFNMGFMHYQGGFFQGYDLYNHYMTAKYFPELGYKNLPPATLIADAEDKNFLIGVGQYRDFHDYTIKSRDMALAGEPEWRGKFSDKRWRQFKEDLRLFEFKDGITSYNGKPLNLGWWNWNSILADASYNPSPVWISFAHIIAIILPVTNKLALSLISLSDMILIAAMGYMIAQSFGIRTASLFVIMLTCSYTTYFSWVGASLFRMDWLALAVIAICFAKKGKFIHTGAFLAASFLFRPFAAMFALGFIFKALCEMIRNKKIDDETKQFAAGFFVCGAALVLLSFLLVSDPSAAWQDYFTRMRFVDNDWQIFHWGFKDIFLWEGEVRGILQEGWQQAKLARLESFMPLIIILEALFVGAIIWAARKVEYYEALVLGGLLIFITMYLSKIYYIFPAALVLLYAGKINETWRLKALSALFALNFGCYWLGSFANTEITLKFIYAMSFSMLAAYSLYAIIEEE